jgi:hypothetical protein
MFLFQLNTNNPHKNILMDHYIYNFGVYLPPEESIENYKLELNTLYTYYSNYGNAIINGDLNVVL